MKAPRWSYLSLTLLFTVFHFLSIGQKNPPTNFSQCHFDEILFEQVKNNPQVQQRIDERDQMINTYLNDPLAQGGAKSVNADLIIPVVVYVVHENGTENISDLQVNSQIDALNAYFSGYGLKFCIATMNGSQSLLTLNSPAGVVTSTPGIFHYYSPTLTNHNVTQQAALTAISSSLSASNYLKIWIVKGITSNSLPPGQKILGYSMLPEFAAPAMDGIVMSFDAFGDVSTCSCTTLEPYSQLGKTLVHEVGHYLGLYHTFQGGCMGMNSSTCSLEGDRVCDTPPVTSPNNGCPSSSWNTCTEIPDLPDDIDNHMDYTDEACRNSFSDGQNDRMFASINLFRGNLVSSSNLVYTGISCNGGLIPNFSASSYNVCVGAQVDFSAVVVPGVTYEWDFGDGSTGTGSTISHTYTSAYQPTSVVLTISDGTNSASATESIYVSDCSPIQSDQGIWYFGNRGGMNFSSGAPVYDNGSYINNNLMIEACAVQGDPLGNLLFYTNGIHVWDNTHNEINLNDSLLSDKSAHRGALIVPNPANSTQYYIFTKDDIAFGNGPGLNGFRYSIVNVNSSVATMSAQWNVPITPPAFLGYQLGNNSAMVGAEGITAVKSCNGYWILTCGIKGTQQYITVFELTTSGLSFVSEILTPFNTNQSSLEVSRDGKRIALGSGSAFSGTTSVGLAVYDFDVYTGIISNQMILSTSRYAFGMSFSPDSKLLYVIGWDTQRLFQYDLEAPSPATSALMVGNAIINNCDMQLGPDDKLYLSSNTTYVRTVHQPNVRITPSDLNACSYSPLGPQMQTVLSYSMPNMIDANSNTVFSNSITASQVSCLEYNFTSGICAGAFSWNFGDPASGANNTSSLATPSHVFTSPGTYTISVTAGGTTLTEVIQIGVDASILGSTTICMSQNTTGNYASNLQPGQSIVWTVSGGGIVGLDNQQDLNVSWTTLPGTVTATITDNNTGCTATNTITVIDSCAQASCPCDLTPNFSFTVDTVKCIVYFNATSTGSPCLQNITYSWDMNGVTLTGANVSYSFPASGAYTVCLTATSNTYGEICTKTICKTVKQKCDPPCDCELKPYFSYSLDKTTCIYYFKGETGGPECLDQYADYYWDFGDGTTATGQYPNHSYLATGSYEVCLHVVIKNNLGETLCEEKYCEKIDVECKADCDCKLDPYFKYDLDETTCEYSFKGYTGGPACIDQYAQYYWEFGDGSTATGQYPTHTYSATGSYEVCLYVTVQDAQGNILCEEKYCEKIDVECKVDCDCKLDPYFKYSLDKETCFYSFEGYTGGPECLQFAEYYWDFGDGTTSMGQFPGHAYKTTGSYEVCLHVIIRNEKGEVICEKKYCEKIDVECKTGCDCKLDPWFNMTQIGSCKYLYTAESGSPCVPIEKIEWVVNGSIVSTGQNFIFEFNLNQTYEICVIVTGNVNGEYCKEKFCKSFFTTDCYPFGGRNTTTSTSMEEDLDVTLYPNPASDQFQVKINDYSSEEVNVTLRTLDGKIIATGIHQVNDQTSAFNVQLPKSLAAGIIIVEIQMGDQTITKRLAIE